MKLNSTDISTFKQRLRLLTNVLIKDNMPKALAEHYAGETLLRVYARTSLVTCLSLYSKVDQAELLARFRLSAIMNPLENKGLMLETDQKQKPHISRKQKRFQQRAFDKFLKKIKATDVTNMLNKVRDSE